MTSRKNKVLIFFALLMITLNVVTMVQVNSGWNDQPNNEAVLPSYLQEAELSSDISYILQTYNDTNLPNLALWDLNVNVTRLVSLLDFGYVTVNDTYSIIKNDNITMPIFRFAYPNIWSRNLVHIEAKTMWTHYDEDDEIDNTGAYKLNNTEVYEEYSNQYYSFYAVKLTPVINNNSAYTIRVFAAMLRPYITDIFVPQTGDNAGYIYTGCYFNYSIVPLLSTNVKQCISSFSKPTDGEIISNAISPVTATIGSSSVMFQNLNDVEPFNFTAIYTAEDKNEYPNKAKIGSTLSFYPPIEAINYKRTLVIDNWNYVQVYEEITLKNFGYGPTEEEKRIYDLYESQYHVTFALTRFHLWIDNVIEDSYTVSDELGTLGPRDAGSPMVQKNRLNAYLRLPIMGGEVGKYFLKYKISLEDVLKYNKTEYLMETLAIPKCDFHVSNFELKIVLPQGANFQYVTFGRELVNYTKGKTGVFLNFGRKQTINFACTNISTFSDLALNLGYYMNDLAYFIQPLIFSFVTFLACLAYIGIRTLRKDVIQKVIITQEAREEIPLELIQSFVEKYEEKTALQKRISDLDEDRRKKKVKAKEYDQQRKILESKMRELIKSLDTTKRALKEKGRKYSTVINKIEVNEEKRISIERSIQDLRIRYIREKQISKDAYVRILRDYQTQIEKFDRDIDREIINLRLLIEHESKDK
ncbi:MAG: hypothetical protein JXA54_11285 [Candidatus Heimdallarchaeota archaeon]|nr:hypothetical protein [Candidatus Heimdallarchaeota archaeon]